MMARFALRLTRSCCLLWLIGAASAASGEAPRRVVDLAGDWRYLPYDGEGDFCAASIDDHEWPTMHLPSNWFLLGSKHYPRRATAGPRRIGPIDPGSLLPADPEQGLDYAGTVWFRRAVSWEGGSQAKVMLDLDMVDYYARVFVNGVQVGSHEGYFQRFSLDVSAVLHPGSNLICVRVSAPSLVFDMSQQHAVSWPKQQNQVKGIFLYHDTRPGATSPRGQERATGGILRGVALRESSGIELAELMVTPRDVSSASARLVITAQLRNLTGQAIDVTLEGEIAASNFSAKDQLRVVLPVHVPPGESQVRTEVQMARPALWWSWDYGPPNLYRLAARLVSAGTDRVLDERSVKFGVRSIQRDTGWVFRLNGQRIYLRGSNYIATQWLSQANHAFYERDVRMIIGANLNSVRVHAHLERPEFYEVADELGLLVWQDFPLQWGYTDLPSFHSEALRQAREMITQYHNHPSIIVWCMHNESPHAMDWMKLRRREQNLLLDNALFQLAADLDPSRLTHRDSGTGDGHYYYGWYEGRIGDLYPLPRGVQPLVTEYGAQALPVLETLREMFDPRDLWPVAPEQWAGWRFADFQPEQMFGLAQVAQGEDIRAFVENSQRYQAVLIRYQTEIFRRAKWTRSTGIYHFMFVDDWPSITWSVVDYYRRRKPGYDALRDAMRRLLVSIEYKVDDPGHPLALHVVNDRQEAFRGARLRWQVIAPDGQRSVAGQQTVDIAPDSAFLAVALGSVPGWARGLQGQARLEVYLEDETGKLLSQSRLSAQDFILRAQSR